MVSFFKSRNIEFGKSLFCSLYIILKLCTERGHCIALLCAQFLNYMLYIKEVMVKQIIRYHADNAVPYTILVVVYLIYIISFSIIRSSFSKYSNCILTLSCLLCYTDSNSTDITLTRFFLSC